MGSGMPIYLGQSGKHWLIRSHQSREQNEVRKLTTQVSVYSR